MTFTYKQLMEKKKSGQALSYQELSWLINSYLQHQLPDYQMSALLAAMFFQGLTHQEMLDLSQVYLHSGLIYDLKMIPGWKVDKHSTGGVGDKTTLIFTPLVASFGLKVAKISGRALGQTGGTIDKLEAIPGWKGELSTTEFQRLLSENGMVIASNTTQLAPADAAIYALRDATQLVDSLPLIAASIMSKKLAIDTDSLILDIKVGSGAFMKDFKTATVLAKAMIDIGTAANRQITVMLTEMSKPLGKTIGTALEVHEAWETLQGHGSSDVIEIVTMATALALVEAGCFSDLKTAQKAAQERLQSGAALPYFKKMLSSQGGDWIVLENYQQFFTPQYRLIVEAPTDGYLNYENAANLGFLAIDLGAGRLDKKGTIDYASGIKLLKSQGELVKKKMPIMVLYSNQPISEKAKTQALESVFFTLTPQSKPVIKKIIR